MNKIKTINYKVIIKIFIICMLNIKSLEADFFKDISDIIENNTSRLSYGVAVTDIDNQELTYGKSNYEQSGIIVASNSKLTHERSCLQIKEVIKKYDIYPLTN